MTFLRSPKDQTQSCASQCPGSEIAQDRLCAKDARTEPEPDGTEDDEPRYCGKLHGLLTPRLKALTRVLPLAVEDLIQTLLL